MIPNSNSDHLTVGQTGFSLSCNVSGTDNLHSPMFTYQWRMDGSVISGQHLSLSPLTTSHARQYTCRVTVASISLNRSITVISNPQDVRIKSKFCNWGEPEQAPP